jgi:hypothetical protein
VRRRGLIRLFCCLFAVSLPAYAAGPGFVSIDLIATPIEQFQRGSTETRFGQLEFRGGLQLASTDRDFGSLSGLDLEADGETIVSVADTGFWFSGRIVEKDGRLVGVDRARWAPILDASGKPVVGKRHSDAEGLRLTTRSGKPVALVSFEQVNNVRLFAGPDFAGANSEAVKLPATVSGMPANQGLEAMAIAPARGPLGGAIVLIAERSLDKAGNDRAWIVGGPLAGSWSLTHSDDFDETDAAFLPGGDLLVLERRFSFATGPGMRIRRIAGSELKPGAVVAGTVLIEADLSDQIDNMEGLAIKPGPDGETLLLIVSDDNNSVIQRTLLLQFALVP